MPKKIPRDQIIAMLLDGYSGEEIADELSVSRKTISKIKKELIEKNPELAQTFVENKYNTFIRKSEEKFLDKIKAEQHLFEDTEEGWIYHLTAEDLKQKTGGAWWTFIVYPESAPKDWKERLRLLHCEVAISPLHDKDVWEHDSPAVIDEETGEVIEEAGSKYKSGSRKKSHYHGIIKFTKSMKYKEVNELIRDITHGPYLQKCLSLKGAYEYFIHLNHPHKYQYEKSEIERYNAFVIETTNSDRIVLVDEIGKVIREQNLMDLEAIRNFYEGQYEYINVIALKSYYFEKLTQANFRRQFPEGRIQQVRIIKEDK